ncbi:MAG TPA: hotdog domain-containing protein [Acidimicrobiales bacterium]|nr:hotdog domain-containing protein [Acidimicrobiales bacterium]
MDVDTDRTRHVLVDLGFAVRRTEDGGGVHGSAEIVPEMWVPGTTSLRTSILATWVDHVAGLAAIGVLAPRVPVTLELDVHVYDRAPSDGDVHALARVLKAGRTVVVCGVDVTDRDGEPVAIGTASFMAAPTPGLELPPEVFSLDAVRLPAGRLSVPFAERAGCEVREPGVAMLPRTEESLNASRSVNGGLIALAVEEAALSLTPGATLSTMAVRFLAPVRTGPAVATAEVRAGLGRVEVRDAGKDDRPAVLGTTRTTATHAV